MADKNCVFPPTFVQNFHDVENVKRMEYRELGDTDMVVSKLSLGGGPFGGIFGECEPVGPIVHQALQNGINYIDTAYWYGQGLSEQRLGKALRDIPRKAYFIGTKVGRYDLDRTKMFDFSAERTLKSVDESLARLQLPYVDVIQIHDVEFAVDESIIFNQTLPAVEKVKSSGKARYIGITGYPLSALMCVLERSPVKIDVILTYCRATLNDITLADFIPQLKQRKIGIINGAATGMGLLSPQGPPAWHPATPQIKDACNKAKDYCQVHMCNLKKRYLYHKKHGVSISKLATHYSLNFPGVDTTLCGSSRLEFLRENLQACRETLTKEEKSWYFLPLKNDNWEGIELRKHKEKLKSL